MRQDSPLLAQNGIMLRRPREYRKLIRGMVRQIEGPIATPKEQELLLASIVKNQEISRLILSDATFLGVPAWMLGGGRLYRNAGKNTATIRNLLPDYPVEFFLCIRNPATFLPAAFQAQTERSFADFFNEAKLFSLRWSDVIADIQKSNPGCPITVWCYEDLPIIWPTVLKDLTGLGPETQFKGGLDVIKGVLTADGAKRLESYYVDHPVSNEAQGHRVLAIFLEKFADESKMEDEIDVPGWSTVLIEKMTELYEEDTDLIERMPGVDLLFA